MTNHKFVLELIEENKIELVTSSIVEMESNKTPDPERVKFGSKILSLRFINQYSIGNGNYIEMKDKIFNEMTVEDIVSEVKLHSDETT